MINRTIIFLGTAFTSASPKVVKVLKDHLFFIGNDGLIEKIVSPDSPDYQALLETYQNDPSFHKVPEGQFLFPGFVDLHVHAPQWAQSGTALDLPLL